MISNKGSKSKWTRRTPHHTCLDISLLPFSGNLAFFMKQRPESSRHLVLGRLDRIHTLDLQPHRTRAR